MNLAAPRLPLPAAGARRPLRVARPSLRALGRRARVELNLPLVAGVLAWLGLYVLAVYGPRLAPHDQFYAVSHIGSQAPPFPPGPRFPLGSDQLGRDVLSWVLIGARPTLLLVVGVALVRMALALPLGLLAGWRIGSPFERALTALAGAMGALPAVAAAMLALLAVGVARGPVAFVVGMAAFGWAAPLLVIRQAAAGVAGEEYIAAARALGATDRRLIWRHVLPNVLPSAVPLLVFQAAACLLLLTELGFLQLFLGGGTALDPLTAQNLGYTGTHLRIPDWPEWGGLLAQDQPLGLLYTAPWIVLAPLAFIAAAALGTAALGNGLARYARRRDLVRLVVPRRLAPAAALLVLVALPARLAGPADAANVAWARRFDAAQAAAYQATLTDGRFGDRAAGSPEAGAAASWLADQLGALGARPAGDQGYLRAVPLPGLLASGEPTLSLARAGAAVRFGPPDVAALAVPFSAGGAASGALVFVGQPGVFHAGQRYQPISGTALAREVAVLAPPDGGDTARVVRAGLDSVANDGAAAAIVIDDGPLAPYATLGPPGEGLEGSRRLPIVKVSGRAAAALLAGSGLTPQTAAAVAAAPGFAPRRLAGTATVASGFSAAAPVGQLVEGLLPGAGRDHRLLVVAASYDAAGSRGDGSGAAVLLALAALLRQHPLPADVLFLGLPGGPPGDAALAAALASPPLAGTPVALAVRLDDVGGGAPLRIGVFSPSYQPAELAAAAGRAAGDVGAATAAVPLASALGSRAGGSVSVAAFSPLNAAALDGPAVALAGAAQDKSPRPPALAQAGRTAALLLARAASGQDAGLGG